MAKKKIQRTNNDLQSITHKTKDRVTRTPLKPGANQGAPEGKAVAAPLIHILSFLLNEKSLIYPGQMVKKTYVLQRLNVKTELMTKKLLL